MDHTQVMNCMSVNKYYQNFYFGVKYTFNEHMLFIESLVKVKMFRDG